jgi:hypothetical protein
MPRWTPESHQKQVAADPAVEASKEQAGITIGMGCEVLNCGRSSDSLLRCGGSNEKF